MAPFANRPPDPAAPPRLVVNTAVHQVACEASRQGIGIAGLPQATHWHRVASPLAIQRMAPAMAAQGDDLARGLLLFAEGKTLRPDDGSAGWLGAHLGGCFAPDGQPDDEARLAWACDKADLWCRIAEDPLGNLSDWAGAHRPWSALAAAIEFAAFLAHPGGKAHGFVSHLPVTLTGSQLLGAVAEGSPVLSQAAVYCAGASAAAHGVEMVSFGNNLFATHAADAWFLTLICADAFKLIEAHSDTGVRPGQPAASFTPTLPVLH